jgi:carbon-monoxide dehydrogenase iron sulfur subunit
VKQKLVIDLEKCTECRTCELKCSFVHFGVFNLNKSGIKVIADWPRLPKARLCVQCEDPSCLPVCPTEALLLTEHGNVKIDYELCIACGACVDACPYDGIWLEPSTGVAIKCDTCEGRFECIPDCSVQALSIGA